jgi:L-ribulose-5-phosphate 3-epimerase
VEERFRDTDSRRDMLKAFAGALPALYLSAASAQTAANGSKTEFVICDSYLTWTTPEAAVELASAAGFDGVVWGIRPSSMIEVENAEKKLPRMMELSRKAGMSTPHIAADILDANSARADGVLGAIRDVGVKVYRSRFFRYDFQKDLNLQLDSFKRQIAGLSKLNEKYGLRAAIHTQSGPLNMGGAMWDLWIALKELDPAYIGIDLDIGHVALQGGPSWQQSTRFAAKYLATAAVKDFVWSREARSAGRSEWVAKWVPPGEGMVDFKAFFQCLRQVNFTGAIEEHFEYSVQVGDKQVNLLRLKGGDISRAQWLAEAKRDVSYFRAAMRDAKLL